MYPQLFSLAALPWAIFCIMVAMSRGVLLLSSGGNGAPLAAHLLVEQRILGAHGAGDLVDVFGSPHRAHEGVGGDVV